MALDLPAVVSISVVAAASTLLVGCSCSLSHAPSDSGSDATSIDAASTDAASPDTGLDAPALIDSSVLPIGLGEPCTSSADCLDPDDYTGTPPFSACITETTWPNGYCQTFCTSPTVPQAGSPLARGDCPVDGACLPTYMSTEIGLCLRSCTIDSECRTDEGYYCRRDFLGVHTATGVCAPPHCMSRGCAGADCSC